jgi:hypothetical protein
MKNCLRTKLNLFLCLSKHLATNLGTGFMPRRFTPGKELPRASAQDADAVTKRKLPAPVGNRARSSQSLYWIRYPSPA